MSDKTSWIVCPVCDGEGSTVNPAIDGNGLTANELHDDPDFAEDYHSGVYDVPCRACHGKRVVKQERIEELRQNAEDRALAAREDGDYEAYQHARDWRYG